MGNDDLTNALLRAQGVQGFTGGGMAAHTMPDGTVMPGATHSQYQVMGMQAGGPAESISPELLERINRFAGGASGVMDMVEPTKGAISNRELELFRRASPVNLAQELQERLQGLGYGEMLDPQQDMMTNQADPA